MNKFLEKKCEYLSNFFKTAIEKDKLFHSLIFYGSNIYTQYAMALEIARLLNCKEDKSENCTCQNCRWIKDNKHPAVMTVSQIDNQTDSSKTVISEEQINNILDTLINSSDFHRVFIFCSAEQKKLTEEEYIEYNEFKETGFNLPQESDDTKIWYPSGINENCLQSVAANSMLKSLEEPPSNVTFIFLTNNKNDLLQTIVSRSQAFYIPDVKNIKYETSFFEKYFENYPTFNKTLALDFAQSLLHYRSENDLNPAYILDCIQYYLTELLKANSQNKILINKIFKDIQAVEKSKNMLNAYIKEQTVYENLAFDLFNNINSF